MRSLFILIILLYSILVAGQEKRVVRLIDTSEVQQEMILHIAQGKDVEKALKHKLHRKGFINPSLGEFKMKEDTLTYKVNLGKQYSYLRLGTSSINADMELDDPVVIEIDVYEKFVNDLLDKLSVKGQVFSKVQLEALAIANDSTLTGELKIKRSDERKISAIKVKGYDDFPESFFKYYLDLSVSDVFNRKSIIKRAKGIDELGFVRQTKEPQVQFTRDSTLLYMYMEKQKSNRFEGFLGFTNDDQQDLQLNGDLDLRLVNNFNFGESFDLRYKNNGSDQEQFRIGAELPYLFSTPFSLELGLDFFRQDSTFSTSSQDIKVKYQLSRQWLIKTGASFHRSTSLQDEQSFVLDTSVVDYRSNRYMIGSSFHLPTDIKTSLPIKNGIDLEASAGNRQLLDLPDDEEPNIRQFTFKLDNQWYIPINKRQFIYLGNFNRWLISDDYVTNELFRFGGMNNIRGFSENSLFADLYAVLQTEYRYILSPDLFVHSVLDLSYYQEQLNNIEQDLYSIGLGIGLKTQGGTLRLILANGNETGRSVQFDQTQFHIRFSSLF